MVGVQLGKRMAYYAALKRSFNAKFKESSRVAYNDSFTSSYKKSFGDVFTQYSTKPQLSFTIESVVGALDDGILQPGEEFALQMTVKNLGGVATDLNTTVAGSSVVAPKSETNAIAKISSKRITTQLIGRLNPTMQSGQMADIDLVVNGVQVASTNPQVMNQLQIDSNVILSTVATEGTLSAGVTVRNMSTIAAPEVAVMLTLNGQNIQEIKIGTIASMSPASVSLQAAGIDPLDIISGRMTAKIVASKQDRAMDEETLQVKVASQNDEMTLYFDKLVNGKGLVPANTDRETRTGQVQTSLVNTNEAETRELRSGHPNLYKSSPSQTVVGAGKSWQSVVSPGDWHLTMA